MPQFGFRSTSPGFAPFIQKLRLSVCLCTCLYALMFDILDTGHSLFSPVNLLLQAPFGVHSLYQTFTSAFIIPYQGISLSMLCDLGMISFVITPPFAFVHSYLNDIQFRRFLIGILCIGAAIFYTLTHFFVQLAQPTSLSSGLIFATIIFWSLLHYKGQSSLFLVFPISRFWIVSGTAAACLFSPILDHDWIKVALVACMGMAAYLYGITACRLRSHVEFLMPFEEHLDLTYRHATRLIQWHILRPLRALKAFLTDRLG